MKPDLPDLNRFERIIFKRKNALNLLLSFSLDLMQARHAGLLVGTNRTGLKFLPPEKWDRGVMDKFDGKGIYGLILKYLGTLIVRFKGLSPVMLYKDTQYGEKIDSDGIISFVLRKHKEFYEKGIKILIIDNLETGQDQYDTEFSDVSIISYNGRRFNPLPDLKINPAIVRQFKAKNFVSAYIPDYGAIVFNTVDKLLLERDGTRFTHETALKKRLNMLISAIEMASLAYIGTARGRQAAHIIWRKEKNLRKTMALLKNKEQQLEEQKKYLRAVGAVNERQLNMEAVNVNDGVYAFMDMVGSATIRKKFNPRDYFFILNLCHQIAANNASRYGCRVDNFIGDCVFLQNASVFDPKEQRGGLGVDERIMLMILTISSTFNEIHLLKKGMHPMDGAGRVKELISRSGEDIGFRAGMEVGASMIGPLGSQKRKIVTAIGKAVNNASRLESSGIKEWIHISGTVLDILREAYITKDTQVLAGAIDYAQSSGIPDGSTYFEALNFLEYYKSLIKTGNDVIKERKNACYKEFSEDVSYLVQCLAGTQPS